MIFVGVLQKSGAGCCARRRCVHQLSGGFLLFALGSVLEAVARILEVRNSNPALRDEHAAS
jgi:hypothetical protein